MNYIEMFNVDRLLKNCDIELSEEDNKKLTISMLRFIDWLYFGDLGK